MTDPFAYAPDGGTVVVADGPELLAYRSDGAPAWKVFTDGILTGVGVFLDQVVTCDDEGRVVWWNRGNGERLDEQQVQARPTALRLAPDGALALLADDGVWLVGRGQAPRFVAVQGACALTWGPNQGSLGVGTRMGSFAAIDPVSGVAWGTVALGAPIEGCGWSTLGHWVVAAGEQLALVAGDGTALVRSLVGQGAPTRLAVSADGLVVAAIEGSQVAVYELHDLARCGELVFRRPLTDVAFGPGHQVGVGHDDGDATMVELVAGTPSRTEPHPGRGRNTWRLDNQVDRDRLRGAVARHRAGGEPIARWVGPKEQERGSSGAGCWQSVAIVGCATILVTVVCTGMAGGLVYLQQQGYL